jgi:3-hydroxyisobutyrate dehydrogenase
MRLKLVTNNWIAGLLGALAETIALAEALDVDPATFLQVIEGGPLGLPYAQLKGNMMIERDFPTSFSAKLVRKDVGLVLDAASQGPRMELARSVAALLDRVLEEGRGDEDMAVVYETAREPRSPGA